jgi:hypothetical protein
MAKTTMTEAIEKVRSFIREGGDRDTFGVRAAVHKLWGELDLDADDQRDLAIEGLADRVRVRIERGLSGSPSLDFWSEHREEALAALLSGERERDMRQLRELMLKPYLRQLLEEIVDGPRATSAKQRAKNRRALAATRSSRGRRRGPRLPRA